MAIKSNTKIVNYKVIFKFYNSKIRKKELVRLFNFLVELNLLSLIHSPTHLLLLYLCTS